MIMLLNSSRQFCLQLLLQLNSCNISFNSQKIGSAHELFEGSVVQSKVAVEVWSLLRGGLLLGKREMTFIDDSF